MSAFFINDTVCHDPWRNLATEECLLARCRQGDALLYLWQNAHTVVIGRHQNPWRECRAELLEQEGGTLARRITGGGAVFHDLGNLNFSFIASNEIYDLNRQLSVVLEAVKSLGVEAAFSGRNDILAEGRKFSGNAFARKAHASLHHGTLLVAADMPNLARYLQVSSAKMESKGIKSVQSRVVNLSELSSQVTIPALREALQRSFTAVYGGCQADAKDMIDTALFETTLARQQSWDWRFGQTPRFDITLETRFPWGGVELQLITREGCIAEAKVYSDAMNEQFISCLQPALEGLPYAQDAIAAALRATNCAEGEDLAKWIADMEL